MGLCVCSHVCIYTHTHTLTGMEIEALARANLSTHIQHTYIPVTPWPSYTHCSRSDVSSLRWHTVHQAEWGHTLLAPHLLPLQVDTLYQNMPPPPAL